MRYRSIAMIQPKSRTGNSGYMVPRRNQVNKKVVHHTSHNSSSKKGSGVIDDADMLYLKQKEKQQGSGLKLAGTGLNPAGGAVMIESSGEGLDLPGGSLRASLIGSIPKKPKKKVIQSVMKDNLSKSSIPLGDFNTVGSGKRKKKKKMKGMGTAEGLDKIQNALSNTILPKLMKKMGLDDVVPQSLIDKVVETSTSKPKNTVKDIIVDLSKKIIPIVTQSQLAKSGVSGGAYKRISKSKKYKKLHGHMGKYLYTKLHGQSGQGMFSKLWSGFKDIVKTTAPVIGAVAPILFPEYGTQIKMASELVGLL